jgi:hypothetical protein
MFAALAVSERSRRLIAAVAVAIVALSMLVGISATGLPRAHADTAPAPGTPATVSVDALPAPQIDGVGWTQVVVGNTVYVGGNFDYVRPAGVAATATHADSTHVYNLIAYDITTGVMISQFVPQLDGQVQALAVSPDQKTLYVGGQFGNVNGTAHKRLVAFNIAGGAATATVATAFKGQLGGGFVDAIVATAATVYVGGGFGGVSGGALRTNLAAFTAATGATLAWAPTTSTIAASEVEAMVMSPDGSRLIVGGDFTTLTSSGSTTPTQALGLGAIDAATGAVLPFAANQQIQDALGTNCSGGPSNRNAAIDTLSTDGTNIYGGGYSWYCGNFEGRFAANPTTGALVWADNCHGDTYSAYPIGQTLYSVGHVHDCSFIGSFPDQNNAPTQPGEWKRALAESTTPSGGTDLSDSRGGPWNNFTGLPNASLLDWFPNEVAAPTTTTGTGALPGTSVVSGSAEVGWSVSGNSSYVVIAGEGTGVGGMAPNPQQVTQQQGLIRYAVHSAAPDKVGPELTSVHIPTATAGATGSGAVTLTWPTAWDRDNQTLSYRIVRVGKGSVYTTTATSTFWQLSTLTFTDTGLAPGTYSYTLAVTDPDGNVVTTGSVKATVT